MLTGGVDEIVDWSKTAPKRKYKRPADTAGDFDDKVRQKQEARATATRAALYVPDYYRYCWTQPNEAASDEGL